MKPAIPARDFKAALRPFREEVLAAITRVLDSGVYILGDEVSAFEQEFAAFCGSAYAVGTATGTGALELAIRACGIGPGDEVITVSHTSVATITAIERAGADAVPVDIDRAGYTLDPSKLEAACTPRSRAILPVHLYGSPADLATICALARSRGLKIIEDCAQACGTTYAGRQVGTFGDAAAFSFYPTKNLAAYGDGGAVITQDPQIAERVRSLRQYGWDEHRISQTKGMNSRLIELQAAMLRIALRHVREGVAARIRLAALYDQQLEGTGLILPKSPPHAQHSYHLYVARHKERNAIVQYLRSNGLEVSIHYPVPVHRQPAYQNLRLPEDGLPETESAAAEVFSLPLYPEMEVSQVRNATQTIRAFFAGR